MNKRQKVVIANWKMNPTSLADAQALFRATKRISTKLKKTRVIVCPPFLYLGILAQTHKKIGKVLMGAQNTHYLKQGSYTGEVSPEMLARMKIRHVIVGHSERRAMGETDQSISRKVAATLDEGIIPIVCIGEQSRDDSGEYLLFLERQITNTLERVSSARIGRVFLAYEPVWAIGKTSAQSIDAHSLHETILFIKKVLIKVYGRTAGGGVPILYGGSVESTNASVFLREADIDGFLVGHASLDLDQFKTILSAVDSI